MADNSDPTGSILVLAPQPFFQNRGTPIAVKLLVEELALAGNDVHLLVFHEGDDIEMTGVTLHRIPSISWVKNIPPSISWKKIVCDCYMFFKAMSLHRRFRFDLVHAVEESVFMALLYKWIFKVPFVYDMDSSLVIQLLDKLTFLKPIRSLFTFFEKLAVRGSIGVTAVCKDLADIARSYAPGKNISQIEDISLLADCSEANEDLRDSFGLTDPIMLYVGNLEGYQGIDLLLNSFSLAVKQGAKGHLVIIGGTKPHIESYTKLAKDLHIDKQTLFCGPRPVEHLAHYLNQADILLSPRVHGNNTPMKLYSYLDSGKPVLATNLLTHTQVLTDAISLLVAPEEESMAAGIQTLLINPEQRQKLGLAGQQYARDNHSLEAFRRKLRKFYNVIWTDVKLDS